MPVAERNIVASGGFALGSAIQDFILGLARGPRVCFVGTATGDDPFQIVTAYERLAGLAQVSHLKFFPWPPGELREFALSQDVIYIGGGNTANMLAIWRVHGFDSILREAWESGIVLAGSSAGMICWFEAGVTDSFGPQLEGMRDGLGFLPGSACPHYDGEDLRRPRYRALVDDGFPAGYAAEDAVALHFAGTELAEVVAAQPGKRAYRVEPRSETPIEARLL
jgi:peptidase E